VAPSDFVSRGQELVTAGQYQEAVKVCRLGLLARPGEVNGRLVLASALLALRRYDEVLAEMRVAIELEPGNAGGHQLRGTALLRKGDPHAAVECLERARKLAGGDPTIAALLEEARVAQAAAGPGLWNDGDSMTKHYPTHRGEGAAGSGASGSHTRPIDRRRPPADATPPPETLRVGDKSGTVELDPELEGVELEDDDVAEPPESTSSVEVLDDDLEEVDDDARPPEAQTRAGRPRSGRPEARPEPVQRWDADELSENMTRKKALPVKPPPEDAETAPRDFVDSALPRRGGPGLRPQLGDPGFEEESSLSGRASNPRLADLAAGPLGGLTPAPVMTPSGRFLSNPSGPGAPVDRPEGAGTFGPPSGPVIATAHAPTVAGLVPAGTPPGMAPMAGGRGGAVLGPAPGPGGPGPAVPAAAPQAKTMVPFTAAAVRPTVAMSAAEVAPAPAPAYGAKDPGLDAVLGGAAPPASPFEYPSMSATPPPPALTGTGRGPGSPRTSRLGLRSRWMFLVWIGITGAIIGGGVFAGFKIRDLRLAKQIASAKRNADAVARTDTWVGWRSARDRLAAIYRARGSAANRAALAKARAILAGWFQDDLDGARTAVAALGDDPSRDAALARAYLAIALGDGARASAVVKDAGGADADPELALAAAQAALVDGRWDAAASGARRAIEAAPRPAAYVAACNAEAARQRFTDADRACAEAERLVPGHPAAVIARARLRAASGAARAEADRLRGELEAIVAEAARPVADQRLGASVSEGLEAQLALAAVAIAVGDAPRARAAIDRVKASELTSRGLLESRAALALALGDVAEAGRLAEQGLDRWPGSAALIHARARSKFAAGDLAGAAAALDKAGAVADDPAIVVLSAELAMANGDLDGAAERLDKILGKRPEDLDALVARAEVDLANGDPRAAQSRLEPRYSKAAPPRLTITYAAALRMQKRWGEARSALSRLLTAAGSGPITGAAWLEQARIDREDGNPKEARAAYARAQEMLPASRDAKLEAATLMIDDGDARGGRDSLRGLVDGSPGDAGAAVELARAQILTGDLVAAEATLAAIGEVAPAVKGRLARERGRLALRRRDPRAAVSALRDAVAASPTDVEAAIMLLDAHILAGDVPEAKRAVDDFNLRFGKRDETGLVTGRLALVSERFAEALTEFITARNLLAKAPQRLLSDAIYWVGYAHYANGDLSKARGELKDAIARDPTNADAHGLLGAVLIDNQEWVAAADALTVAVALDPDNADAWYRLGGSRLNARRTKDGKAALETYLKRWPTGEHAAEVRQLLAAAR
jgi:tetratricopeptide (TPR) repeat protein